MIRIRFFSGALLNDTSLRNTAQALVAPVVRIPKECRKRIEQVMVDAGEAVDTEAVKRPRGTDDPGLVDTVESETKNARLARDETARDMVTKLTTVDSLLCVKTSVDLTTDALAWSRKIPAAALEQGRNT